MSADANGIRKNPIQEMFWTRTGLLLAVLLVISIGSLWISSAMDAGLLRNLVTALGTGTMVSAIVGFGQTLITAAASQKALVTPLIEESKRALRDLSAEYRALNNEFFPTHVFEASAEPDPEFNRLLMQDLRASRHYFFRGFSGRHAAARLLLTRSEWELRTVVADPRQHSAISGRARYLLRNEGATGDYDKIRAQLIEEISIGIVGLFLARSRCTTIDIAVISDPPLDRTEIFDDSVWLTLYSDVGGVTSLYPRTLRFSEGSFIYGMQRAEFQRMRDTRTAQKFVITPDTSRQEFLALFEKITSTPLSEEGFGQLERKFHDFREEFTKAAGLET
ncbi:hypothetical protein LWC34_48905 [Kibdelosporangium philippinense]|uniref:Uncharacterized protein n=1 Tax=Kibdelosporangium philippinense TaxID=211113 RepID=A0ABS8ZSH0_9PSEU|nr:hypothetical protein [Kibdelosporangium philippinense]MCE7010673.1 hypothetical protein [Kibdelosporangium philippinense]